MEEEDDNGFSLMGLELEMYYDSSLLKIRCCFFFQSILYG